ncbi:Acetyl-hydrolase [Psilocybe cubensis]|uniref:Alpha/beta hydrolase fold-3 domain-containing protein n=2 Tax=Psilocybe cubensis TaxID=181762 RepID=A0A8H7XVI2_PSICU|nr:Acetyl-hydrolase [Psilocybe cubensis]KAH9476808.1 Acetyl-hydrolase [Psilocybe cubensis]
MLARIIGPSTQSYEKWCKRNSEHPIIETIGSEAEQARLLWIGSKHPKRVILYLHGGGFWLPMADYSVKFWRYIRDALLHQKGIDASIAILDYTLIPEAEFPTPLKQTVAAIHHLLSNGVLAGNIQIAGDSAGANLVLQLILHMLHPLEDVPSVPAETKFCGAYLMSPWLYLRVRKGVKSYSENEKWDVIAPTSKFTEFGDRVLAGLSDDAILPYIDAASAPPGWYSNAESIVDRVLITGGGKECIRDDIVEFGEAFCKEHSGAQLVIDEYGVHDDPFYDFLVGEKKLSELTPKILQWLAEGFKLSDD